MRNVYVCYDKKTDILEICNSEITNIVNRESGHYGIEFGFDIHNDLISILIPEPDILFGIDKKFLDNFDCNNLT